MCIRDSFTNTRGNDFGNGIAMLAGFIVVGYLSGLDKGLMASLGMQGGIPRPDWMVEIEFPWRILFGTVVTFAIAMGFKTPENKLGHSKVCLLYTSRCV